VGRRFAGHGTQPSPASLPAQHRESGDDADTPTVRRSRPLLAADTGHQRGYRPRGSVLFLGASGGVLAWCAAATYSSFLLAGWVHSPLPATTSLVSELEATGQPHHLFFRLTGVLSGIAILAVATPARGVSSWRHSPNTFSSPPRRQVTIPSQPGTRNPALLLCLHRYR